MRKLAAFSGEEGKMVNCVLSFAFCAVDLPYAGDELLSCVSWYCIRVISVVDW